MVSSNRNNIVQLFDNSASKLGFVVLPSPFKNWWAAASTILTGGSSPAQGVKRLRALNKSGRGFLFILVLFVAEELPSCSIRRDCRWWKQEGKAACMRCPQVITDNYNPSELAIQVSKLAAS